MEFFTPVEELHFEQTINPGQKIISLGSCFAETMGEKLSKLPLEVISQPFGTLFHPLSILRLLQDLSIEKTQIYRRDGLFVHPHFHSKFASPTAQKLIEKLKIAHENVQKQLQNSDWLIITFGTAFYYFDKEFQLNVANCHKQPGQRFEKKLSKLEEIVSPWISFSNELMAKNPSLNILFTLSPVRHTKDGIQNNQISKSTLRLAIHEILQSTKNTQYFPAYEYILDELRDYRYFKKDLIHPNEIAEEFVYEKMKESLFGEELLISSKDSEKLEKRKGHI
ncbi:GSCFA family protein [Sandaracinomonas limnophila]|uniref:GSCFA family protein n=1 Tax=Sandaracinomonas limnophila TaxID=1862386 RepID=A0A437PTY1_9BACT|nr:GSCFA domain-containing protein [Sandaracinomonas limnophila]RVU25687.1 GSCFA family protein [Sandaracinomonas limnophila]